MYVHKNKNKIKLHMLFHSEKKTRNQLVRFESSLGSAKTDTETHTNTLSVWYGTSWYITHPMLRQGVHSSLLTITLISTGRYRMIQFILNQNLIPY